MNHLEMQALCTYMNLTPESLAEMLNKDLKYVKAWLNGKVVVPDYIADELLIWTDWVHSEFTRAITKQMIIHVEAGENTKTLANLMWFTEKPAPLQGKEIPYQLHNAIAAMVFATSLNAPEGIETKLCAFDNENYTAWRKDKGYADTSANRYQWMRSFEIDD